MRKTVTLTLALFLILFVGCGTLKPVTTPDATGQGSGFRRIVAAFFTQAALSDFQLEGAAGTQIDMVAEIVSARSPELSLALTIAVQTHLVEAQGPRLLQITLKGETAPRTLICRTGLAAQCAGILPNTGIRVFVQPVGLGPVQAWIVHRIVVL